MFKNVILGNLGTERISLKLVKLIIVSKPIQDNAGIKERNIFPKEKSLSNTVITFEDDLAIKIIKIKIIAFFRKSLREKVLIFIILN